MVSTIRGDDGFDSGYYTNLLDTYAGRNKIINGSMDVWQRGNGPFTYGYTADRWVIGQIGHTVSVTRGNNTSNVLFENATPTRYLAAAVSGGSATSDVALVKQPIEDVRTFAGQTITISFWAASSADLKIAISVSQSFGTGGDTTQNFGYDNVTPELSGTFTKHTFTVAVPSIAGKTVGADSYLDIKFYLSSGSDYDTVAPGLGIQTGSFYITQVQVEAGTETTPYEVKPIGQVLAECQRYYQVIPEMRFITARAATAIYNTYFFPTTMRAGTTITWGTEYDTDASGKAIDLFVSDNTAIYQITMTGTLPDGARYRVEDVSIDAEL